MLLFFIPLCTNAACKEGEDVSDCVKPNGTIKKLINSVHCPVLSSQVVFNWTMSKQVLSKILFVRQNHFVTICLYEKKVVLWLSIIVTW